LQAVQFRQANAMALPYPDDSFDVAVMPLVIFFVPDPVKGVAEMARVVGTGGTVTAYSWDMVGGGFPYAALHDELRAMGVAPAAAPSLDASRLETMRELWIGAGLESVETREIVVQRTFAGFDEYWTTIRGGPSVSAKIAAMPPEDIASLKARIHARFPGDAVGHITYSARANAVTGRVTQRS
jgi:SAM-dependent methyltransferase